jgi:hypothetical protein
MTQPLPVLTPVPSGWYYPPPSGVQPGTYFFETVGSDCIFLQTISGVGNGHIFEGINGIYLFGLSNGLLFADNAVDFTPISSYASSVTQMDSTGLTVIFKNTTGLKSYVYSQKIPETYNGWNLETTISGTMVSDSAGEPDEIISVNLPTLVGNSRSNTYPRVQRITSKTTPLGAFAKSDTGIPINAQITDLEAV